MSKVQFNLLPDVKLEYIKTERTRNLVTTAAFIASAFSIAIFLLLFLTVNIVQKQQLNSAKKEVETASKKLQEIDDFGQALTVQNQLITLANLHQNKHITSRLFSYLPQITPTSVNITSLTMDLTTNSMTITGTSNNHQSVNQFIDTLKFTTFKVGDEAAQPAFPSVIESSFGIGSSNVTYSLNVQFEPRLFSNSITDESGKSQVPTLTVPTLTTTRSILQIGNNPLFKAKSSTQSSGGQQ